MEDTSGFYKFAEDQWFYGPHFVYSKDYSLERDGNRESIDGWEWHDTAPEAYIIWELLQKQEYNTPY
jgi:hypothetical protein